MASSPKASLIAFPKTGLLDWLYALYDTTEGPVSPIHVELLWSDQPSGNSIQCGYPLGLVIEVPYGSYAVMLAIAAVTAIVAGSSSNAFAKAVTEPSVAGAGLKVLNADDGVTPTATSATH